MLKNILRRVSKILPDNIFVRLQYKYLTKKKLNIKNPVDFNEKLQWLKLYDRNPAYTIMVDKYEVRKYIKEMIGEEYLIPLLGVWKTFEEIDFNRLPDQFVLKCTHDSNSIILCKDKSKFDVAKARQKLNRNLKKNFYWYGREWPYRNVQPRIICEKYMVDESGTELKDYKVLCFNGIPKLIQVDTGRFSDHKRNVYTTDWQYANVRITLPNADASSVSKPKKIDEMLSCARILAKNIPHVRVDFYSINDRIYFGEITFFHGAGYEKFLPESYNRLLGSWIELPTNIN